MNIKWRNRFLKRAKDASECSKDPSKRIGAVFVNPIKKNQIVDGFNGFPRGIADTEERLNDRETKYKYVVHAEQNGIYNASYIGACLDGSYIYVYGLPICNECAKGLIQVGIKHATIWIEDEITQRWLDAWEVTKEMFDEVGITYEMIIGQLEEAP